MSLLNTRILQTLKLRNCLKYQNLCSLFSNLNTKKVSIQDSEQAMTCQSKELINKLKSTLELEDLKTLIQINIKDMSNEQLIASLKSFVFILNYKKLQSEDITNNNEFLELCYYIKSKIRFMSLHEHINILKLLANLNIRKDSLITQIVLKMILYQVNDLSLEQIHYVKNIMKKFNKINGEETTLHKALNLSIKHVNKIKVDERNDPVIKAIQSDYPWLKLSNRHLNKDLN